MITIEEAKTKLSDESYHHIIVELFAGATRIYIDGDQLAHNDNVRLSLSAISSGIDTKDLEGLEPEERLAEYGIKTEIIKPQPILNEIQPDGSGPKGES